jgi:hypothetical protein
MKFTVTWQPAAERALTAMWLAAQDRKSISDAAAEIDRLLESRPMDIGESRELNRRVAILRPLGVLYEVNPSNRTVKVANIWPIRSARNR